MFTSYSIQYDTAQLFSLTVQGDQTEKRQQ